MSGRTGGSPTGRVASKREADESFFVDMAKHI